jgi:hypothetical protein
MSAAFQHAIVTAGSTAESWDNSGNASVRGNMSRPTRPCGKCGRKFLLTHVVAHEGGCAVVAPVAKAAGKLPKKKSKVAAKKTSLPSA